MKSHGRRGRGGGGWDVNQSHFICVVNINKSSFVSCPKLRRPLPLTVSKRDENYQNKNKNHFKGKETLGIWEGVTWEGPLSQDGHKCNKMLHVTQHVIK